MDAPPNSPHSDEVGDERVGCLDIVAATAGMGCAMAIRTIIIVAAFAILIIAFRWVGFGSGTVHHHLPLKATPVVRYGIHGWAFVFAYFLHFEEKLRRRVVNQFHRGIDILQ